MGLSVINWGGVVASKLSETSIYPLQTSVATKEFQKLENLRASTTQYGMTKLSTATDITDVNSYALSASENNPNIKGTVANKAARLWDSAVTVIERFYIGPDENKPVHLPVDEIAYIISVVDGYGSCGLYWACTCPQASDMNLLMIANAIDNTGITVTHDDARTIRFDTRGSNRGFRISITPLWVIPRT